MATAALRSAMLLAVAVALRRGWVLGAGWGRGGAGWSVWLKLCLAVQLLHIGGVTRALASNCRACV